MLGNLFQSELAQEDRVQVLSLVSAPILIQRTIRFSQISRLLDVLLSQFKA